MAHGEIRRELLIKSTKLMRPVLIVALIVLTCWESAVAQESERHRIVADDSAAASGATSSDATRDDAEKQKLLAEWTGSQARKHDRARAVVQAVNTSGNPTQETVTGVLTLLSVRFVPDSFGNAVVIGEVQNHTSSTISFAQARFAFFNSLGLLVGVDDSYVMGSHNARLVLSGGFTSVLPPGHIGFFKVWTALPLASLASYSFGSEAETYATVAPRTPLSLSTIEMSPNIFGGTDYNFFVFNDGTSSTAYFLRAYVAGYLNGVINDVQFSFANGASITQCGVTSNSAIPPGELGYVDYFFLRPVSSIARIAFEWEEVGVAPSSFVAGAAGGSGLVQVFSQCPWTAVSNVGWIAVTSGASGTGDGAFTIGVAANTSGMPRIGSVSVAGLTVTVEQPSAVVAPTITTQPVGRTIITGQPATLSVGASGTWPLSYQWFLGATGDSANPVIGATGSTYTTPNLAVTTNYWVRVSNAGGSVNSNTATITVLTPPSITSHPASVTINSGQSTTLGVVATGTGPFSYQWYQGTSGAVGSPIPGATSSSYTTPALTATTSYWVRVSNAAGSADSNTATVTVSAPPAITSHPASITVDPGQTTTLSVVATGGAPLTYQWYVGSSGNTATPIAGATSSSYTTPAMAATTSYWVRVSNGSGVANSNTATVSVRQPPFTDVTLIPGISVARLVHIIELRTRINALRARFGLLPYAWTDPSPVPGVTNMKAVHTTELRVALAEVYAVAARPQPVYTDPDIVPGVTVMKVAHIAELRAAVIAIE